MRRYIFFCETRARKKLNTYLTFSIPTSLRTDCVNLSGFRLWLFQMCPTNFFLVQFCRYVQYFFFQWSFFSTKYIFQWSFFLWSCLFNGVDCHLGVFFSTKFIFQWTFLMEFFLIKLILELVLTGDGEESFNSKHLCSSKGLQGKINVFFWVLDLILFVLLRLEFQL